MLKISLVAHRTTGPQLVASIKVPMCGISVPSTMQQHFTIVYRLILSHWYLYFIEDFLGG